MNRFEPADKPYDAGTASTPASLSSNADAADRKAWLITAGVLLAGCFALIGAFRETVITLVGHWDVAAYNHGYLIVPISLYVAWERRVHILPMRARPTYWGLMPALGFAAIWAVGDAVELNVAKEFAVIGLFQTLIFSVLGWRVSRALMFPILYTWLMLPVGEALYPVLQSIATALSVFFISLTPLPVFNEDSVIYVTSGTYRIAEVCAGLNFIFATIALSLIYGTLMYSSLLKRIACIALMLPLAVVGNGFRIFLIIYANHYLGANIDIVGDHYFYGWVFFGIVFLVMMWVGLFFRDPEEPLPAPQQHVLRDGTSAGRALRTAAAALAIFLTGALAPGWSAYRQAHQEPASAVDLAVPAALNGQFTAMEAEESLSWKPVFPQADVSVLKRYGLPSGRDPAVDLFIAYYAEQNREKEVVSYQNGVSAKPWLPVAAESLAVTIGDAALTLREDRLRNGNDIRLTWSLYWIGGRLAAGTIEAKLLQAWSELIDGDRRAAGIVVSTMEAGDRTAARERLQKFLNEFPMLAILDGATETRH